ncbi:cytidine deaminase [Vulgatibacter incomptus]|uniref:Cytidine deaminase n=1 Tax=Vulgatibacter incomptus TaxID=1391653 RepID=A0A0K1P9V3_9BACT|nr:cytidine deaminase [Vulgatibacter incomptus]AKU90295.1 Cytidine deaminase [Vulgatibacter incomptus]
MATKRSSSRAPRKAPAKAPAKAKAPTRRPVRNADLRRLLLAALAARQRAYAPYSRYQVGAAVLGDDGRVYAGCNVENSSYGVCLCAERNAVGQAIARGARRILAAAVVTSSTPPAPPCGICLQTFAELADSDLPILLANPGDEERRLTLAELLPHGFGPAALKAAR